MNCKEVQLLLQPYIEGHLPEEKLPDFLAHIEECPKCREDLKVFYAIFTAINQLNQGDNFSDDYSFEINEKLTKDRNRLIKRHRHVHWLRRIAFVLFLAVGFTIGLNDTKSIVKTYLPSSQESHFSLGYYGMDRSRDPVYRGIRKYNAAVIEKLHELEEQQETTQENEGIK